MASTGADTSQTLPSSAIETSQGVCAICLGIPENKSFASNCLHEFCFTCLLEWSKVKAECPLCKQSFCSIIHNVKSDHEYDDLEIKRLGKYSSVAFQSSTPPLQQQMQHNLVHANNVRLTIGNHLHASAVSTSRQSIQIGVWHGADRLDSEQQTVAQNDLTNIQQPRRRTTSVVRYALRSRVIIQEDIHNDSNVEHVNEFRPSPPTLSETLLVSNVTAASVRKSQWWHSSVATDKRNRMVQKLIRAIIPGQSFVNQNQREKVVIYTRQIEMDIYMTATSKHLYNTLCFEKITELKNMNQSEKRIRLQSIQFYGPSSSLPRSRSSTNEQVPVLSDETNFTTENFRDIDRTMSEGDEDDDLAILEIPPKPVPEIITLSDSDDE